ncbi:polysaccharide pyruvyl transferase family protein [Sutcliffiella halmapala]|uniref:polysaccharide pyruvyl transferase family protein n=1 Tax=Sutcliffiella halmapala TaxID=79882 RepID=UPI000995B96E|nr:polysaccharide pyruvyl transferase family protein [Sutcliffiella halmapala]
MKKIMLNAYTNRNLGDDLFIKVLCERYLNTEFVLYAPKEYKEFTQNSPNINFVRSDYKIYKGINFILRKLNVNYMFTRNSVAERCDAGIYIGGSLFMQYNNWENKYKFKKGMYIPGKPFFLLGANFGPYKSDEFYLKYKSLFSNFTDICFREKYSYNLFQDLGNVRVADDIIFQLKKDGIEEKKKEKNIVISVIKPSRKHISNLDEIYYNKIKDIAIYFINRDYNVTLMSFCEPEGDNEAVEKIISLIPFEYSDRIARHLYELNIEETLEVISKSSLIIATRFHAMILGWIYNRPVYPIAYSEKMTNVMEDVNFKGAFANLDNISETDPKEIFESMDRNIIDISKQIVNSEKHFAILDEYLLNK